MQTKNQEEKDYWNLHQFRLNETVSFAKEILAEKDHPQILDVGPHFLTILIKEKMPDAAVDSLGYWFPEIGLESAVRKHYPFDLANITKGVFPQFECQYDLISMAEVFEHLYISPKQVLSAFHSILAPGGSLLLTTPNGVSLSKRIKMLLGVNPFEMPRETLENPGHFREYTAKEMEQLAKETGYSSVHVYLKDVYPTFAGVSVLDKIVPSLRQNLFCVLTK